MPNTSKCLDIISNELDFGLGNPKPRFVFE